MAALGLLIFTSGCSAAPAVYNVRELGAKADGTTKDTAAIQDALDRCAAGGGGTVLLPAGNYLTGSLQLKSNTNLQFQEGATLTGSLDAKDYPVTSIRFEGEFVPGHRALIWAEKADHIAITGNGMIQGPNVLGGLRRPRAPVIMEFVDCKGITLSDFSARYQRMWSIHILFSQNIVATNLNLRSTPNMANGDGFDIDSSRNVRIDHCDIDNGDDAIALKSGRGADAVADGRATENVQISNCKLGSRFAGVGIGTEMSAGVRNVRIEHCTFTRGDNAIFIKSRTGRSGVIENITGDDLTVTGTHNFLGIDLVTKGIVGTKPVAGPEGIPVARNIRFSNVKVQCMTLVDAGNIAPEKPLDGLTLSDISGTCERSISLANMVNVNLKNIQVSGYTRPFLATRNVSGTGLENAAPLAERPAQIRPATRRPTATTAPAAVPQ
jgi:polygalacturonase